MGLLDKISISKCRLRILINLTFKLPCVKTAAECKHDVLSDVKIRDVPRLFLTNLYFTPPVIDPMTFNAQS